MAAYAKGLARDLAELAASRREVTVADLDATHAMLLENPARSPTRSWASPRGSPSTDRAPGHGAVPAASGYRLVRPRSVPVREP